MMGLSPVGSMPVTRIDIKGWKFRIVPGDCPRHDFYMSDDLDAEARGDAGTPARRRLWGMCPRTAAILWGRCPCRRSAACAAVGNLSGFADLGIPIRRIRAIIRGSKPHPGHDPRNL